MWDGTGQRSRWGRAHRVLVPRVSVTPSPCIIFSTTSMMCWSPASRPCGQQEEGSHLPPLLCTSGVAPGSVPAQSTSLHLCHSPPFSSLCSRFSCSGQFAPAHHGSFLQPHLASLTSGLYGKFPFPSRSHGNTFELNLLLYSARKRAAPFHTGGVPHPAQPPHWSAKERGAVHVDHPTDGCPVGMC